MESRDTQPEARFIRALALISERMIQLEAVLRGDSWQRATKEGSDIRQLEGTVFISWYAEVELATKEVCCWWFEIQSVDHGWTVERNVNRTTPHGQEVILEMPSKEFHVAAEMVDAVPALLAEFTATVSSVDLAKGTLKEE